MSVDTLTIIGTIVGTVVVVGIALAGLIMRAMSDIRADMREFRSGMADFRTEMQRLAERQSHLEGRIVERGSAAD